MVHVPYYILKLYKYFIKENVSLSEDCRGWKNLNRQNKNLNIIYIKSYIWVLKDKSNTLPLIFGTGWWYDSSKSELIKVLCASPWILVPSALNCDILCDIVWEHSISRSCTYRQCLYVSHTWPYNYRLGFRGYINS